MNLLERWQTTFNHEEPDYVSSFVQVVMSSKKQEIDEKYGETFTEEDLCFTPFGDYTIRKWCGFESSWGAHVPYKSIHHDSLPDKYLIEKDGQWVFSKHIPSGNTHYRILRNNGTVIENMRDNRDINFYVDGKLYVGPGGIIDQDDYDAKATIDLWNERLGGRQVELYEDATYDNIHKDFIQFMKQDKFLPIFSLPGFVEPIRESFGLKAYSRFLRKNPEVIQNAVDLYERPLIVAATAAAKAEVPFLVTADDIAFKHNVFCSPRHYKKFFSPLYRKVADIVHSVGAKIFFHSDGYTEPYYDTWINDCKFDGQESLEPQAWVLPEGEDHSTGSNLKKPGKVIRYLKEKYGDTFVLLGNMDMSTVMPLATPSEVAKVTKDIIESGAPNGGFVFACCTDITSATPLDNILAMRAAYKKYRTCY